MGDVTTDIAFTKGHGTENDFVLVPDLDGSRELDAATVVALADRDWKAALAADPALAKGLSTHDGQVVNAAVAEAFGLPAASLEALLG